MKIQNSNSTDVARLHRSTEAAAQANSRGTSAPSGGTDHVRISALTQGLAALAAHSNEQASKVLQLSSAVESGRYRVDAQAVSHKIVETHLLAA